MNREIWGVIIQVAIMIALSYPLGKYIATVYKGEKNILDFLNPFENWIYRLCSINPREDMNWKRFVVVLLLSNLVWFVFGLLLLLFQGGLPLNPDHNPNMPFWLAVNTCISFLVNCNLQHYAGETSLTYLTQLLVVMLFQFVTAATGMAAFAGLLHGMSQKCSNALGNFWVYLIKGITRILLPISLVVAIVLAIDGVPMTFQGKQTISTVEGGTQTISQGPVAAVVAIKQLGTNGGGYFGTNSAHPLENPSYFSNMVECISIILIPMALVWCLGFYLNRKKFAFWIFVIMLGGYLTGSAISIHQEMAGNPKIAAMGISQPYGSMEGKETRFGSAATALWAMTTTATSNGSVNGMQDSMTPVSTVFSMINMQINCWFGGVGVGFMNYYIFIIIAVFISGLMVGRTPEFLGKKIEAPQMKVATLIALLHPFLILTGTALAAWLVVNNASLGAAWLNNPSYHGLSEMLYEFSSASANNGSGMEGLADNSTFWNISTSIVLLLGRYLPIIGVVAISGLLAQKRYVPVSAGTLPTDTLTFSFMTLVVIIIVAALAFFPVLALSSIAEFLSI